MNDKKSIPYLLSIIILLVICSATSIGYIIGISKVETNQQKNVTSFSTENDTEINSEIAKLKSNYNFKIEEKKTSYKELEMEKARVQELLFELEKAKGDANLLLKYKVQYQNLEAKMFFLVNEIAVLKNNKVKAVNKVNATKPKAVASEKTTATPNTATVKYTYQTPKKEINTLNTKTVVIKNEPKIEKVATELNVKNLETIGYNTKSSTKNEITILANRVDFIKISFTVSGNSNIKPIEKKYYIQVINGKNNVLGNKTTEYINGKTLTYSMLKTIQHKSQDIQVVYELIADKFDKGNYFICVFDDRCELMAKTNLNLK